MWNQVSFGESVDRWSLSQISKYQQVWLARERDLRFELKNTMTLMEECMSGSGKVRGRRSSFKYLSPKQAVGTRSRRAGCTGAPAVESRASEQRLQTPTIPAGPVLPVMPSRYNRCRDLGAHHQSESLARSHRKWPGRASGTTAVILHIAVLPASSGRYNR